MKMLFLVSFLCVTLVEVPAQNAILNNPAIDSAVSRYHRFLQPETGLYNGTEYLYYANTIKIGNPFFLPDFQNGSVVYNKMLYEDIPLLYDVVTGELVLREPWHLNKLSLIKERISQFTITDHEFVRLTKGSGEQSIIKTGFYELLYNGKCRLYKKQNKNVQERLSSGEGVERRIDESVNYFLEISSVFYEVNSKSALLDAVKDRKSDLQQFIRKNKLRFKKDKEAELLKAVKYYDQA